MQAVVTREARGSTRPDSCDRGPEVRDRHRPATEVAVRRRARYDAGGATSGAAMPPTRMWRELVRRATAKDRP